MTDKQISPHWYSWQAASHGGRVSVALMVLAALLLSSGMTSSTYAQFGGGAGGMGGAGAAGAGGPGPDTKPKFQDHIHSHGSIAMRREKGDAVVLAVQISGNRNISKHEILQQIQTRQSRFYDSETVLSDVRKLQEMGSFSHVTFRVKDYPQQKGVVVTFIVKEAAVISQIVYHGNRGLNDRELHGRAGLTVKDALSEFTIESARRRMEDYYHEEGFNQATITTVIGYKKDPGVVIFRINEGPKERIRSIRVEGNTILSESRLKKIIKSRGPAVGIVPWLGNTADMDKINRDKDVLASTYHNLGYLTATVGHLLNYSENGKWLEVTFVVNEGPRFKINNIQIEGNKFVTTQSLRARLTLKPGDTFDGTKMRKDIGELVYGYGELGFIYAEVAPQTVMRDDNHVVDLIYKIDEGDLWKVRNIRVNIEGEPHLMRESTMLNLLQLREGDVIDRRELEVGRRRLGSSQLLETNPQIADPPDIIVEPIDNGR